MNVESDLGILKSFNRVIEPAFGITLPICTLAVAGRPQRILIMVDFSDFRHVTRIEIAVEDNLIAELFELESALMGYACRLL